MLIRFSADTYDLKRAPLRLFYSYSHKDEEYRQTLEEHLTVLKRQGFIESWSDRQIRPGDDWRGKIDANLEKAHVILLLISSSFIASDYCYDVEMKRALERHEAGVAVVLPIILRPVFWQILPFAKLKAVPKDGKPIATFNLPDEAYVQVAEALRAITSDIQSAIAPSSQVKAIDRWHWVLKLDSTTESGKDRADRLVLRLRNLSGDPQASIIASGDTKNTLIISGSKEGFRAIENLIATKELTEIEGVPILSFYLVYGAGIRTGVEEVASSSYASEVNVYDRLVYRSRPYSPRLLKGVFVPLDRASDFDFISDGGDEGSDDYDPQEMENLISYFLSALAVSEDNLWVNLSAYESNRMIPPVLEGTQLGRDLLEQDCVLKQLTASLVHPDTDIGRSYWREVFRRAHALFGSAKPPLKTFQKVWLYPEKAVVFEAELPKTFEDNAAEFFKSFAAREGHLAYIVEGSLAVGCEEDIVAQKEERLPGDQAANDFALPIFREIVLPAIQQEANKCINFKRIRQIYHSIILAAWYRRKCEGSPRYGRLVDTGNPGAHRPSILKVSKHSDGRVILPSAHSRRVVIDSQNSATAALDFKSMDVKENREYFARYMDLFEGGSFSVVRREIDEYSGVFVNRRYFSGRLDFTGVQRSMQVRRYSSSWWGPAPTSAHLPLGFDGRREM